MARYRSRATSNALDTEAFRGLALCSLRLLLYEPAAEYLRRYLELHPDDDSAHYYQAIALLCGKRPRSLKLPKVREIERCLEQAIRLHDRDSHYLYLLAAVRQDYYVANGLTHSPPSMGELLRAARRGVRDPRELNQLLECVDLPDGPLKTAIRGT